MTERRKCLNDPDRFCHIYGQFTPGAEEAKLRGDFKNSYGTKKIIRKAWEWPSIVPVCSRFSTEKRSYHWSKVILPVVHFVY